MEEILKQLGELLLGAIPTVVLFVLLYAAYRQIVHKRLESVLEERHARTEGAVEKANADIAAAEARTAEYEQRLREARLVIFKKQEARRQQLLQARSAAVAEARAAAGSRVQAARAALQNDVAQARTTLQAEAEKLASEIIRTILKPALVAESPMAGGQPS